MTHSNTPWPAYDWTGKIVVVTGDAGSHEDVIGRIACYTKPARADFEQEAKMAMAIKLFER